jgi:hypothetical protein
MGQTLKQAIFSRHFLGLLVAVWLVTAGLGVPITRADDLIVLTDQMSRVKASVPADHSISFITPSGIGAGETLDLDFPIGFDLSNIDFTDIDLADDGIDIDLAGGCSGATWGASVSGQILTLTSCTGVIIDGSTVSVEIGLNATWQTDGDNQITNCSLSQINEDHLIDVSGSMADSGVIPITILAEDQIAVTGLLEPTLTFTLDLGAMDFGLVLDSSVAGAGPNNLILATNSPLGYSITVRSSGNGSQPGLWNSGANHLIASSTGLLEAGVAEGYGGQCVKISGEGSCSANFDFSGDYVGDFSTSNQVFASHSSKPAGAENFTITLKAAITGDTLGGEYVDRLTFTATALY